MKQLHRNNLWCWSAFDAERNIDFNSYLIQAEQGNVLIDPLPLSEHDRQHLKELGGAAWVVITNSDHNRAAQTLAAEFGAKLAGPRGEEASLGIACDRWLGHGDELIAGLEVIEMHGSKTPGELALLLGGETLITGDLVRAHRGGQLMMLPPAKLKNVAKARESVANLAERAGIEAVLVGDGWPVFRDGAARLRELVASF